MGSARTPPVNARAGGCANSVNDTPTIRDEDIPQFARRCWQYFMEATEPQRKREKESIGFWIGGKYQWREGETENRQAKGRPWLTINRCKPAVDQVENEARDNPPGPQAHPVGGGADKDGADILEGLIREYEYRSHASGAYITGLRYAAAGGSGAFELATEYVDDRSMEQQLVVKEIEDPATVFYDPEARRACREDSMWMGKVRVLSREKLIEEYPEKSLKILNRTLINQMATGVGSWMQEAVGMKNDFATLSTWTGSNRGPFYVCEFWRVAIKRQKLTLYSNGILYFEGEDIPAGVEPETGIDGPVTFRNVPRRQVFKYVVTALDTLEKTEWLGKQIPIFWIMGPEVWRDKELHRQSLITGAMDSNRGLNYTATSAAEITGTMTKAPFIGYEGQFDITNAQGFNPWENSTGTLWSYLEVKPVFATDPITGQSQLLPPPQRNTWEAPISRLMELATFFGEQIKAATSVFFEPATTSAQMAQSGAAIKALQQQTNVGTINWQDNLHRAVALSYNEAAEILPKLYDGARVKTIVRPDNQHEVIEINREFPSQTHDFNVSTGKYTRKSDKVVETNNSIALGKYSLRVTAGASFETRTEKRVENLTEVFKIAPQLLSAPAVAANFLRMVGEGDPQVEQMADSISPDPTQGATPEQMGQQLQAAEQKIQALTVIARKMQQDLQAKLPQVQADKWKAALAAVTRIRVAEINASKDADNTKADNDASLLETLLGAAHARASQAMEHQQQGQMAQQAQATAQQQAENEPQAGAQ